MASVWIGNFGMVHCLDPRIAWLGPLYRPADWTSCHGPLYGSIIYPGLVHYMGPCMS